MSTGCGMTQALKGAHRPPSKARTSARWWRWVLIYPILAIALVTAAPHWIEKTLAAVNNTSNRSLTEAKIQSALWSKNLPCTALPFNWYVNPNNIQLDSTICDSGDIFVRASTPDRRRHFYWIPVARVIGGADPVKIPLVSVIRAPQAPPGASATPAVSRGEPSARNLFHRVQNAFVTCQRFVNQRRILRHLRTPQGCFDEVIDTYNGTVAVRRQVPCRSGC
jgi:hypothetical protein